MRLEKYLNQLLMKSKTNSSAQVQLQPQVAFYSYLMRKRGEFLNETETKRKIYKKLMSCLLNHPRDAVASWLASLFAPSLVLFALCNFSVQLACDVLSDGTKSDNAQAQLFFFKLNFMQSAKKKKKKKSNKLQHCIACFLVSL